MTLSRPVRLLVAACLAVLAGGCFWDYTFDGGYRKGAETVAVPVFDNLTTRRGQEFDLTNVVAREVATRTPFRVVGSTAGADLVIRGTIVQFSQPALVQGESDEVLEGSVLISLQVRLIDGRSGKVLRDVTRSDWASLVPARGETVDTARFEVFDRLAQWVVRQLEEPW
jgi:hypothetical protein